MTARSSATASSRVAALGCTSLNSTSATSFAGGHEGLATKVSVSLVSVSSSETFAAALLAAAAYRSESAETCAAATFSCAW